MRIADRNDSVLPGELGRTLAFGAGAGTASGSDPDVSGVTSGALGTDCSEGLVGLDVTIGKSLTRKARKLLASLVSSNWSKLSMATNNR
jgi:hypothetical protein